MINSNLILSEQQLALLQVLLPTIKLRDVEEACEEVGLIFEDFLVLYHGIMSGKSEKLEDFLK